MEYEAVIGLETHVQLKTATKMWCGCLNQYGAEPNTNVCPVCLGMPGALPVANEEALRKTALAGALLKCDLPPEARFDRKNYFYPDVAKNYQITQLAAPSTIHGSVEFETGGETVTIRLTRAHLEEDVGKSSHFDQNSGVDFNRAGTPLLEIVSEPELTSADMAYDYLNALKAILVYGDVSECDMEKGMVRCDVNISVRPVGQEELGAKVEIKNMNSFSGVRRALNYEIPRQMDAVARGETIRQETRRWDDIAGITEPMRDKEQAHDYRYFPDPDLMPIAPSQAWFDDALSHLVELPLDKKRRLMNDFGLAAGDADVFVSDPELGAYFEDLAGKTTRHKALSTWVVNDLRAKMTEEESGIAQLRFAPEALIELLDLIGENKISRSAGQEVFAELFASGGAPREIVEKKGLAQVSDTSAIEALCDEVIGENPKSVEDFRAGKAAALNFLKGRVMKASKGKANPAVVGEILANKLQG